MQWDFSSYALGATLYMPIVHHRVPAYLCGEVDFPSPSVVLCLEDALAADDVARGIATLKSLLRRGLVASGTRIFVRPRSLEMGLQLAEFAGIEQIEGFVAPKILPETAAAWMTLAEAADLRIMPTVESSQFFDPGRITALRDILDDHDKRRIAAIRLGGNDLLAAMALRRQHGITSWEGPLAWVLAMASSMLISAGYPVAAPVFDIIGDMETLKREVAQDVAAGFISKTAIHPAQVDYILDAFRVSEAEIEQAKAVLDNRASAVFQIGGMMCEPSTHSAWAKRILARAKVFGVQRDFEFVSSA
ncbi:HpcH/HpaI aldolase/citrate lyase family protein [Puniceibacterium sp. IMCC21224]|uniref:HpcH/HpaI aldolase/citrate lyase family protein n=1 Tax=Puniceibacterium sp. IMCC21224 TaxID=1618204 RepID=UPI00064DDED5|nr:HpcH/HpaI aldolase/citrate lyase family protein [Puniceibacterium sp. IMCC21224]KMK68671.1 citrate lyase beta subunit [Puniceibacterium sp. IMCC21224]